MVEVEKSNSSSRNAGETCAATPSGALGEGQERTYSQAEVDAILRVAYPIMHDGPHKISEHRRWLSRQLLDSMLSEEEAYSIVRHSPAIHPTEPTSESKSADRGE